MRLNQLKSAKGAIKKFRRIARGDGSSKGGTAGRGHKGQSSRSGYSTGTGFEGGQMPLYRRMPKQKGFRNLFKRDIQVINISQLEKIKDDISILDKPILKKLGLIEKDHLAVKLLGNGELSRAFTIQVQHASKSAISKVEKAGGKVALVP